MLIDIANGEKTISALRMFLGLDFHKVEVSDYEKYCLFPTITEANPLPLLSHPPYSSSGVAKEVIGVSGKQSPPIDIPVSDILSMATLCQNLPKSMAQMGPESIMSTQKNHYSETYLLPQQDWLEKSMKGSSFRSM